MMFCSLLQQRSLHRISLLRKPSRQQVMCLLHLVWPTLNLLLAWPTLNLLLVWATLNLLQHKASRLVMERLHQ